MNKMTCDYGHSQITSSAMLSLKPDASDACDHKTDTLGIIHVEEEAISH